MRRIDTQSVVSATNGQTVEGTPGVALGVFGRNAQRSKGVPTKAGVLAEASKLEGRLLAVSTAGFDGVLCGRPWSFMVERGRIAVDPAALVG